MNRNTRIKATWHHSFRRKLFEHRMHEASRGFTLVELLVLLAVLAVLAATMIPALARAKPNSLALQCMNNLRQWSLAARQMASDNNDVMARDGTDPSAQYSVDSGITTGPGTPNDQYAWFNVVPPALGEKTFSNYWNSLIGNPKSGLPFPGGQGRIWHCPAVKVASTDVFLNNGTYGFFSYNMNIDLKLYADICAHAVIGNSYLYPTMPKYGAIRNPSAVVLFTDVAFSPTLEPYTSSPTRNGIYPCARWNYFPKRHNSGGTIAFTDGHSAIFKWDYVNNSVPTCSRVEKYNPDIWWNPNRDIP